jgi:hypothetical protein
MVTYRIGELHAMAVCSTVAPAFVHFLISAAR